MQKLIKLTVLSVAFIISILFGYSYSYWIDQERNLNNIKAAQEALIKSNIGKYKVAPHVIKIEIRDADGLLRGSGTGFHMTYIGITKIYTNLHICEPTRAGFNLHDASTGNKLRVIYISTNHDLCVVASDRKEGLSLADKDIENGDRLILVGHPRGLPLTIREGFKVANDIDIYPWLGYLPKNSVIAAVVAYPGNSGSPVTNENGEVIGVLFAGDPRYNTEGLLVPYEDLLRFIKGTYNLR